MYFDALRFMFPLVTKEIIVLLAVVDRPNKEILIFRNQSQIVCDNLVSIKHTDFWIANVDCAWEWETAWARWGPVSLQFWLFTVGYIKPPNDKQNSAFISYLRHAQREIMVNEHKANSFKTSVTGDDWIKSLCFSLQVVVAYCGFINSALCDWTKRNLPN